MIEYWDRNSEKIILSQDDKHKIFQEITSSDTHILAWGAVKYEAAYNWQFPYPFDAVIDRDSTRWQSFWNGSPIISPEKLSNYSPSNTIIVILPVAPARSVPEIQKQISSHGPYRIVTWTSLLEWSSNAQNSKNIRIKHDELSQLISDGISSPSVEKCNQIYNLLQQSGPITFQSILSEHAPKYTTSNTHVAMISDNLPLGGSERQLVSLADELINRGTPVDFCFYGPVSPDSKQYLQALLDRNIQPIDLSPIVNQDAKITMQSLQTISSKRIKIALWLLPVFAILPSYTCTIYFETTKPAATLAYLDFPSIICGIASLLAGVPQVAVSGRNYSPEHYPDSYSEHVVGLLRQGMQFITSFPHVEIYTNSQKASHSYEAWLGPSVGKVKTIYNCINPSFINNVAVANAEEIRAKNEIPKSNILILGVFRLVLEKNPFAFVDVIKILLEHDPSLQAVICGVGYMRDEIEAYAREIKIPPTALKLVGASDDIASWMKAADVLLHTANYEGMPSVILEAQLAALPIVCTKAGGTEECLAPPLRPYSRDCGDVQGLAEACLMLMEDKSKNLWMSQVSAEIYKCFSPELLAAKTSALLGLKSKIMSPLLAPYLEDGE